jgi:hypothetical protein
MQIDVLDQSCIADYAPVAWAPILKGVGGKKAPKLAETIDLPRHLTMTPDPAPRHGITMG